MSRPVQGSTSPGIPGGQHASTCPEIQFLEGQHVLTCLGIRSPEACLRICTLTWGQLALTLQQYWLG